MEAFSLHLEHQDGVMIIRVRGYLEKCGGKELQTRVYELLHEGRLVFLLDLSECKLVSSPGVMILLELVLRATDDFRARLAISGVDGLKSNVLWMAGVSNVVPVFALESEALGHLSQDA